MTLVLGVRGEGVAPGAQKSGGERKHAGIDLGDYPA